MIKFIPLLCARFQRPELIDKTSFGRIKYSNNILYIQSGIGISTKNQWSILRMWPSHPVEGSQLAESPPVCTYCWLGKFFKIKIFTTFRARKRYRKCGFANVSNNGFSQTRDVIHSAWYSTFFLTWKQRKIDLRNEQVHYHKLKHKTMDDKSPL